MNDDEEPKASMCVRVPHSPPAAKVSLYDKPGTKIAVDDLVIKVAPHRLTHDATAAPHR